MQLEVDMGDVVPVLLVMVIVVALVDLLVTATLLLVRRVRRPPAKPLRARPVEAAHVAGTVLFRVPERRDPDAVLGALAGAGHRAVPDPEDDRVLLLHEPCSAEDREQVRLLLARESVPVRFTDE